MRFLRKRWVVMMVLFAFTAASSGCGYLIHPERRTEKLSTKIDTMIVVFDCLWLLAGVVPGVVAIAVDATNNTWKYTEKELEAHIELFSVPTVVDPGTVLTVNLHGLAPASSQVRLCLTDARGGGLVASVQANAEIGRPLEKLSLQVPKDMASKRATLALYVDDCRQLSWDIHLSSR